MGFSGSSDQFMGVLRCVVVIELRKYHFSDFLKLKKHNLEKNNENTHTNTPFNKNIYDLP